MRKDDERNLMGCSRRYGGDGSDASQAAERSGEYRAEQGPAGVVCHVRAIAKRTALCGTGCTRSLVAAVGNQCSVMYGRCRPDACSGRSPSAILQRRRGTGGVRATRERRLRRICARTPSTCRDTCRAGERSDRLAVNAARSTVVRAVAAGV